MNQCPCGTGNTLDACCGPYLAGDPIPTAEATMRARYTAHVQGNADFLFSTLSKEQRFGYDKAEAERSFADTEWQDLEVRKTVNGGEDDDAGQVEFIARYRAGGQPIVHHELSFFAKEDGHWVFTGCEMNPKGPPVKVEKVGRNQPCPCGSGKKYKKCCGA